MSIHSVQFKNSLEQLKYALTRMVEFARKDPKTSMSLFVDGIRNYEIHKKYIEDGVYPRFDFLFSLVENAQRDGYLTSSISTVDITGFLLLSVVFPELYLPRIRKLESLYDLKRTSCGNEDFFEKRMSIILDGLKA